MVTETTNIPVGFGYHLNVDWDAPIHIVTNGMQITGTSLGHTEYGVGHGMTFQRDDDYYGTAILHCTYTEIR
jgi:hypothetical protein